MQIDHNVQLDILKQLLFKPEARFRDLNKSDLTNDHFTFHLKRLTKLGLISKSGNLYKLTPRGLEIAGRLDLKAMEIVRPPKVGVSLFITKGNKGVKEILLEERLKDPSKGKVGSHTEKVKFGESLFETAKRCLKNETGLTGKFEYAGVIRIIRKKNDYPAVDVLLNFFRVKNPKGELIEKTKENRSFWLPVKEVHKLKNTFEHFKQDLELLLSDEKFFKERIVTL